MDDDNLLGEETSKETRIININELEPTGDWYDDAITDDDDALLYEYSDEEGPRHPIFREGQDLSKFKLVVGMRFRDYKQCRDVLTDVSIREGFELTFLKNEKSRITAKCKENCGWRFHASAVMGGPTIQIKTLKGKHTCPRVRKNWRANYKYLAGVIERAVRENPGMKADQISQYVSRECGVDVTKWTVYRAKKHAMQKIRGVDSVQYAILRDYCETILKFNPRSKIIIRNREGSDPPIFGKLYYSLFGLKMNFLSVCNPIIGLDGCFLKTAFGEQLLAAIGRDGNDGMVPIAIAVVETENYETWTWFLTELLEDIGGIGEDRWTFVSDRQKGLLEALKDLVPNCEHRFCARHMLQNFKKKFKNPDLVRLFWKAAGTGNKNVFDVVMKEIAALDPKLNPNHETVAEWLEKIPPKHWAKSHFLTQCMVDYCKFSCAPLRPPPIKKQERCLEVGHNKATCKNTMHPKSKLNKRSEGFGNGDKMRHQSTQASSSAFASRKRKKSNESRPTRNSTTGQADDTTRESVAQKHGSVAGDDI